MSTTKESTLRELEDTERSCAADTDKSKRPGSFALTEAMRMLLCEVGACTEESLLIEYPNAQAMRALRALQLIRVVPAGLKGWRLSLTARGIQIAEAFKAQTFERAPRSWWVVRIRGLEAMEYFGTDAEAEAYSLERRRHYGGGAVQRRAAKQTEAAAGRRRLEWRRAAGYPLDERELEGLKI